MLHKVFPAYSTSKNGIIHHKILPTLLLINITDSYNFYFLVFMYFYMILTRYNIINLALSFSLRKLQVVMSKK